MDDKEIVTDEYIETLKKTKKHTDALTKSTESFEKALSTVKNSANNVSDIVLGLQLNSVADQLGSMAKKMFSLNSELHRTLINAGKSKTEVKEFKSLTNELSASLGATHEQANKITKELAKGQYAGTAKDIKTAAEASFGLAKAFGISEEEVTKNTIELQKWGQVSANTTKAMYTDLMKVAQANGLTKEGVQEVMKATQNYSGILKAFKKAPEDIQKLNLSIAKSVSALEKVGVSAQTATEWITKMLDPENIEQNIPAYAAMGVSITDAITGNIDPERMTEGLKTFGEKLKEMGPIAGAAYAKAMGVSYKDAIKASSADLAEASEVSMTPEAEAAKQMKDLTKNTMDSIEAVKSSISKIGGDVRKIGPEFLTALSVAMGAFGKKIGTAVAEATINSTKIIKKNIQKSGLDEFVQEYIAKSLSVDSDIVNPEKELIKGLQEEKLERTLLNKLKKKGYDVEQLNIELQKAHENSVLSAKAAGEKYIQSIEKKAKLEQMIKNATGDEKENLKNMLKLEDQQTKKYEQQFNKLKLAEQQTEKIKNDIAKITGTKDFSLKLADAKRNPVKKAAKAAGGAIGGNKKLLATLGVIGLGIGLIAPFLKEKLQPLMEKIKEKLQPAFEKIGAVFDDLITQLTPFIEAIVPTIGDILVDLMDLLKPVLPILVGVLKKIVTVVTSVIKAITTFLKKLFRVSEDHTEAVKNNTKAQTEKKPDQLTTNGGRVTVSKGSSATEVASTTTNNTTTTIEQKTEKVDSNNQAVNETVRKLADQMANINLKLDRFGTEVKKGIESALGIDESNKVIKVTTEATAPTMDNASSIMIRPNGFSELKG